MPQCVFKYDRKVVIESISGTADAHGHVDITSDTNWTEYVTAYAAVSTAGGKEFWKHDRAHETVDTVWVCPYSKTLAAATPDMRLTSEGVTHEIVSVIDIDHAHREVQIQTKRDVV